MYVIHGRVKVRTKKVKNYQYYEAIILITSQEDVEKIRHLDGKSVHVIVLNS